MLLFFRERFLQKKVRWLVLIAISFLSCSVDAAPFNDTQLITLNGPWKFNTGDDMQWASPDFNDADWETVDLTAPPGSHDGDVGLSGYIHGWTAKGHPAYAGYAWYRLRILSDSLKGNVLALTGPPAVDNGYQLFVNGMLLGSGGADFSGPTPVQYSIRPGMFLLPETVKKEKWITIAFRVWMDAATLHQGADVGGIRIAPVLGEEKSVASRYRFQWGQTIKGYIVEVIEPLLFVLLAITMFFIYKRKKLNQSCKWFITGLILLAFVRANQAVFFWFQIESTHGFDIVTGVILRPLILGSWLMAWREWYQLDQFTWMPKAIAVLTMVFMCTQLLALPWFPASFSHRVFRDIGDYTRLFFVALTIYIVYLGIRKQQRLQWSDLLAVLLVSIGLFAQEISALHIKGIWFPFGVGVSRTQFAYAAFVAVMFIILIRQNPIRPGKTIKVIIFFLLFSSSAISQKTAANVSDTMVSNLLSKLTDHNEIDRGIAIKYLHLDSIELQENPAIHSDSLFSLGSHIFWIVSFAAVVNCEYKQLIEYQKESRVFYNRLLIETNCDFDPSGDHITQTAFKIKGNMLYVYKNYYRIRNEELLPDKKHSTYCAYRFPDLKAVFIGKPLPY